MTSERSVILVVTARPRPEFLSKARSVLVEAAPGAHQEMGCQLYAHHEGVEGTLVTIEKWESQEHLERHANSPATVKMIQQLQPLLQGPVDVTVLSPIPSGYSQGSL